MADFHLKRFFMILSLFPKKGQKFQCRFQYKPSFKFTFFCQHSFQDVEKSFKRYHFNNDCFSLHLRHRFVVKRPRVGPVFPNVLIHETTFQSKKKKSSIFRGSKIAKIDCTDLQRTRFVFFHS